MVDFSRRRDDDRGRGRDDDRGRGRDDDRGRRDDRGGRDDRSRDDRSSSRGRDDDRGRGRDDRDSRGRDDRGSRGRDDDRGEVTALEPHHFAVEIHGRIFQAIKKTIERGEVADPVTLRTLFAAEIAFEGPEYLARLAAASASIINAEHYARVIRRLFVQRRMIEAGQAVIDLFSRPDVDSTVEGDVAEAERIVAAVSDETVTVDRMGHVSVALRTAVERAEAAYKVGGITGLPTGLADLDRAITGLHPSNLIVVAGRPGMGKTALGLNV